MIFERKNRKTVKIYRDNNYLGSVYCDLITPKIEVLNERFSSGVKVDFEAYLQGTYDLKTFDIIELDGVKYKLTTLQKYSNFYYVTGLKVENV